MRQNRVAVLNACSTHYHDSALQCTIDEDVLGMLEWWEEAE
jgi:DNA-directed RNA polymerase subunit E'/Rpb7